MRTTPILLIAAIAAILTACGSNKKKDRPGDKEDTAKTLISWEASLNDSTGLIEVNRSGQDGPDSLTITSVIAFLNSQYPNVQLEYIRTSADTLFIAIPDAMYLTQQMGSTGPALYFAAAVYNLTEIPGIRFVNFDFEEGDHAQPSVLNRDSFNKE